MEGLGNLAGKYDVPLMTQGPGLVFFSTMVAPGAEHGRVTNYRQHVTRHDMPRWTHLRRCLLEEGVRAIERGIWFISLATTEEHVEEALVRADRAFERHVESWEV